MRKISSASLAMILGVALYFTLFWGYDALRMLTSPTYGLEDVWRSQVIFGIGSTLGLSPVGLIKLGAFFGVLKLAVALICAVHIVDRVRTFSGGAANTEVLEGGLMLAALMTVTAVIPAVWSNNPDLVREQIVQLAFAGLAVALCAVERSYARKAQAEVAAIALPRGATSFSPWR